MTNPFKDQEIFMTACDQSVSKYNVNQFNMYISLIEEETKELNSAIENNDRTETLDALIDVLVVTIGALHSMGVDAEGAWNEVIRSNMSKIDSATGKVRKREDGKVLKPDTWSPPNLSKYI